MMMVSSLIRSCMVSLDIWPVSDWWSLCLIFIISKDACVRAYSAKYHCGGFRVVATAS